MAAVYINCMNDQRYVADPNAGLDRLFFSEQFLSAFESERVEQYVLQ